MRKNQDDLSHDQHARLWHPWHDKPGMPYAPVRWEGENIYSLYEKHLFNISDVEDAISILSSNKLYCFVNDVLDPSDVPYADDLLMHKNAKGNPDTFPYLSRTGRVAALRVTSRGKSGFFIPSSTWCYKAPPDKRFLENVFYLFNLFQFQSSTPASLSEKVLRSTLPDDVHITRPSVIVRDIILKHNVGGRIDKAEIGHIYPVVAKYDKNKAYLYHSRLVPTPFCAPTTHCAPPLEIALDQAVGFWDCELVAREQTIPAIQIEGKRPVEGEVLRRWLWTGELRDCLEAGYTLLHIYAGFSWRALSDFMCKWSDILFGKFQYAQGEDEHIGAMIKSMMVGLPGRFLKQPEQYRLVPIREGIQKGDIPVPYQLPFQWKPGKSYFSDYVVRPEYDKESTALSPIGSYIIAEMRRELYHECLRLQSEGLKIINTYIDCIAVDDISSIMDIGTGLGQYKEKVYWNMYAEQNRFAAIKVKGDEYTWEEEMRAPGMTDSDERNERRNFWARYYQMMRDLNQ